MPIFIAPVKSRGNLFFIEVKSFLTLCFWHGSMNKRFIWS